MSDLISRQDAIKAVMDLPNCDNGYSDTYDKACIIGILEELPSAFKQTYEKLLPCTCGNKRRQHWCKFVDGGTLEGLKCTKCGKMVWGKSEADARRQWNKAIRSEDDG